MAREKKDRKTYAVRLTVLTDFHDRAEALAVRFGMTSYVQVIAMAAGIGLGIIEDAAIPEGDEMTVQQIGSSAGSAEVLE
jgi:hypothetical protein